MDVWVWEPQAHKAWCVTRACEDAWGELKADVEKLYPENVFSVEFVPSWGGKKTTVENDVFLKIGTLVAKSDEQSVEAVL